MAVDPSTSAFLDAARWLSAWAVVAAHAAAMLLQPDDPWSRPGTPLWWLTYLENLGHLAVVVFFVLSGYLVGGQELLRIREGRRFGVTRYAVQRFSRIYTVLVPALLLTAALDAAGRHWLDGSGLYTNPALAGVGSIGYSLAGRDGPGIFLGTLLMLQTILVEPYGADGPLWSLANEWWYYVTFGLVLVALSAGRPALWRAAAAIAAAALMAALPATITLWASVWLLGVGAALIGHRWRGWPMRPAMAAMAAGLALSLLGMRLTPWLSTQPPALMNAYKVAVDLLGGLAFAAGLLAARHASFPRRIHAPLASFSYTLYAVHFPALVFLGALAHDTLGLRFARPLGAASLAVVLAMTALLVLFAWAFAAITERHTPAVRAWVTGLIATPAAKRVGGPA